MPNETVIDGEIVALDEGGRPSFNSLQNYGSARAPLHFFIFDVLILKGKDVMGDPLTKRRELIEEHVPPTLAEPIRYSPILDAPLRVLQPGPLCFVTTVENPVAVEFTWMRPAERRVGKEFLQSQLR